jgi:hypothetical protein
MTYEVSFTEIKIPGVLSTRQQLFEIEIYSFPTFVFDYRSGQMLTANHKKLLFVK